MQQLLLVSLIWFVLVQSSTIAAPAERQQEAGVEFNGPFSSWLDVRDFGAIGDGMADDTNALERALAALGAGLDPATLYLPSGTYRITRTLQVPPPGVGHAISGKLLVGQDPATTILRWDGEAGGDMVWLAGQVHMRYGRLTLDGGGKAGIGIRIERHAEYKVFSSYVQIHDCLFRGSDYGIYNTNRSAAHAMDAEYSLLRCTFSGMQQAGVRIDAGNAYDFWIRHCLFKDCRCGVQNTYGDFYVMQSRFERSGEVDIEARSHRSGGIRDNVSIGSRQFLRLDGGRYVVQGNRLLDVAGETAIEFNPDFSFTGLLALNNVIHSSHPIQTIQTSSTSKWSGGPVAIIGNTITTDSRFAVALKTAFLSGNKQVAAHTIQRTIPALPGIPPKVARPVVELGADDHDLQAKIDEAVAIVRDNPRQIPVVHISPGEHMLQEPVVVPANIPLKIVGEGTCSRLVWTGPRSSVQPALLLKGPSRVTIEDLAFRHHLKQGEIFRSPIADILIDDADQPGARIVSNNSWLSGVFADGVQNTQIDLRDHYSANYGGWLSTTLKATGPATPGPARIGMFGGVCIGDQIHSHVADGGRILMQDFWHEENSVMKHPWAMAEGQGRQPGMLAIETAFLFQHGRSPLLHLRGFDGTLALLGNSFGGNSDRIEVVPPADATTLVSLLGWAKLEPDTAVPLRQFNYDGRPDDVVGDLGTLSETLKSVEGVEPDCVLEPRPPGVTDVRLHRITALYQNGWGLWVKPTAHQMNQPGVSVTASIWDAYEQNAKPGRFTFTRDHSEGDLTVHFKVVGDLAVDDLDRSLGDSIQFASGQREAHLDVVPLDNDREDGPRTVRLLLQPHPEYSVGTVRQSQRDRVVIHDNDMTQRVWMESERPVIEESASDASAASSARIVLHRDQPFGDLAVHYSTSGTVTAEDLVTPLSGKITIPDGEREGELVITAKDDDQHEPTKDLRIRLQPGDRYEVHPERASAAELQLTDDDLVRLKLEAAGDGQAAVLRNGSHESLRVRYRVSNQMQSVESEVILAAGQGQATVPIPDEARGWQRPLKVELLPIPGSTMARLSIPTQASRFWWAISPRHVVAIDLEQSRWTPAKDTPGEAVAAIVHEPPADWLPSDTPTMGTAVAYDSVADRLWVLVAFSRTEATGPEQTLWRIEQVSKPGAVFHKHATFGLVERGTRFNLKLDHDQGVLVSYGSTGNKRPATRVTLQGQVQESTIDVLAFSADTEGAIWGALNSAFGRPGINRWANATDYPRGPAKTVLAEQISTVVAVSSVPTLVRSTYELGNAAAFSQHFARVVLLDESGLLREIGADRGDQSGGVSGLAWDPQGRLWVRPQNHRAVGVILDLGRPQWAGASDLINYLSVFEFDDRHVYVQDINRGTLSRTAMSGGPTSHVRLAHGGQPLLIIGEGDPSGYHHFRSYGTNPNPELMVP